MQTLLVVIFIGFMFSAVSVFAQSNIFARTLYVGMRGEDVLELQKFLNVDSETSIAHTGLGSTGNETDYFGPATKRALIKFQEKYRADVLAPVGLISGTGIFGPKTREKINMLSKAAHSVVVTPIQVQGGGASSTESVNASTKKEMGNPDIPTRLIIPRIYVDADIGQVGLTSLGAMDIPKGPVETAWFNLGPRPGESGSSVISGHFGWKNGIPAVFDNLSKLKIGDKIYTTDKKGSTVLFVVHEIRSYDQNADASEVFGSSDGKAHLNLVTCQGTWNKDQKSYSNRLVVFADKE